MDEDINNAVSAEETEQPDTISGTQDVTGEAPAKKESNPMSEVYDWMQCLVVAIVGAILVFVFGVRTINVLGPSMEQTLIQGDRIVISKLFYTPRPGDIVVLRKESFEETPIVKRVIAVEGQTIDIDFSAGVVYVDGEALDEPYTNSPTNERLDFAGPVTVPEGCVYVMGDNRNRSKDSRSDELGVVDTRYIMGRLLFRMLPLSRFGAVD